MSSRRSAEGHARRLFVLAAAAIALFVLLWIFAVHTETGQRADNSAIRGGIRAVEQVPTPVVRRARLLLSIVSVGSLVLAISALTAVALLRRRPRLMIVPALVVGASVGVTEIVKHTIFTRPELLSDDLVAENTYPSGHTTIAISLGLACILIAPARLRLAAAIGATVLAGGMGVMVLVGAWHRPSDPLGSYALTVAIASAVAGVMIRRAPEIAALDETPRPVSATGLRQIELAGLLVAAMIFFGSILIASLRFGAAVDWQLADAAFLVSCAAIVIAAAASVTGFVRVLSLPPQRRRYPYL